MDTLALIDEILRGHHIDRVVSSTTDLDVPDGTPSASIVSGAAGVGLAMAELARRCDRTDWSTTARAWSEVAARSDDPDGFFPPDFFGPGRRPSATSFHHGPIGAHVAVAMCATVQRDHAGLARAVGRIARLSREPGDHVPRTVAVAILDDASLVSGLCGLVEMIDDADDDQLGRERGVVESLIHERLSGLGEWIATRPICDLALPNLGAAHGWAGLLDAGLRAAIALGVEAPDAMATRVAELASYVEIRHGEASWPVAAGHPTGRCGGWCNGAAGHVPFWCRVHEWSGDAEHLEIAVASAETMAAEPSAVPNLCCGSAGKVLAALTLFRTTRECRWVDVAATSLDEAARLRGERTPPMIQLDGMALSLYKGDLGVALAAAALLDPERPIRIFP